MGGAMPGWSGLIVCLLALAPAAGVLALVILGAWLLARAVAWATGSHQG